MYLYGDELKNLTCSECKEYLSCGPVYLKYNKEAICGRCKVPEESAVRNIYYEVLVYKTRFPCKYEKLGCRESYYFSKNGSPDHEEVCIYREFACPVSEPDQCSWRGGKDDLLTHCKEQHQDYVLSSPYSVSSKDLLAAGTSVRTFVLMAYEQVFLMHLTTSPKKICYSVQSLEGKETAEKFKFHVEIERNIETILKRGFVAPSGCLELPINTCVGVNISSLVDIFRGINDITFTISVKKLVKCTCGREISKFLYQQSGYWFCDTCVSDSYMCYTCSFKDMYLKMKKHENYFCRNRLCITCSIGTNLILQTECIHKDQIKLLEIKLLECNTSEIIHESGSVWQATRNKEVQKCYISCDAGLVFCRYTLFSDNSYFYFYFPLKATELHKYECKITMTIPNNTSSTEIFTPVLEYDREHDWMTYLNVSSKCFGKWKGHLDICIDINKKKVEDPYA